MERTQSTKSKATIAIITLLAVLTAVITACLGFTAYAYGGADPGDNDPPKELPHYEALYYISDCYESEMYYGWLMSLYGDDEINPEFPDPFSCMWDINEAKNVLFFA